MAYRIEGTDIIIDGFENGIANSPHEGIADMRNMDIIGVPGEASVSFKEVAATQPVVKNAVAYTAQNTGDTITPTGGTSGFYVGTAIVLAANTAGGLSNSVVYYVMNITGTTFQVSLNPGGSAVAVTSDGTGTFTTYQYGNARSLSSQAPISYYIDRAGTMGGVNAAYLVDGSNYAWVIFPIAIGTIPANTLIFLGNIGGTNAGVISGNGVVVWKGYLLLFRTGFVDVLNLNTWFSTGPAAAWTYDWWNAPSSQQTNSKISAITALDDAVYYTSTTGVGSILEVAGATFAPGTPATYTRNAAALALPTTDHSTCIAELGTNLLIGGQLSYIYPWDRISPSYNYPIIIPDVYSINIIGTNQNAYIFAGNRGNVYITNGSSAQLYKKVSDYLTGTVRPYIRWQDASYQRNQLYFSFIATTNADVALTTVNGAWAFDTQTDALRMLNKITNSGYSGQARMVAEMPQATLFDQPAGTALIIGWTVSTTYGVDLGSSDPYDSYESYLETDIIPVGTYLDPFTPSQIEFKLATPLVANEAVRLSYRTNVTEAYSLIIDPEHPAGETSTAGLLSSMYQTNFQKAQWVQFKIETKSTASSPSYVRLTEMRVRDFPSGKNAK